MIKTSLGRHVFGLSAIAFGITCFVWRDFGAPWRQIDAFGNVPHREVFVYIVAAIEILGGIAIQWRKTARAGALTLSIIYFIFALLWIPTIVSHPRAYYGYGHFFEQFSVVLGPLIIWATLSTSNLRRSAALSRFAYTFFGICVVSFALEQLFYLSPTASFVPKWIPPGQMFWAIATTVFFALAAIALLSGIFALLAARLVTAMIMGFQLLIWLPAPFSDPHKLMNWAGNAENLAIAGAAWIVADYLGQNHSGAFRRTEQHEASQVCGYSA